MMSAAFAPSSDVQCSKLLSAFLADASLAALGEDRQADQGRMLVWEEKNSLQWLPSRMAKLLDKGKIRLVLEKCRNVSSRLPFYKGFVMS